MSSGNHETFLLHNNFGEMFSMVSPEQCQRLVGAVFRLAVDGEDTDFSDDQLLHIFWKQISHFIICNKAKYEVKCQNMSTSKTKWWKNWHREKEEVNKIKAELEEKIKTETKPKPVVAAQPAPRMEEEYEMIDDEMPFKF